jgi:multidrug efflux pump subunit AcrB
MLVDDATVEVENIHRNHTPGKSLIVAILDGASQIATPTLVGTLSICVVFFPVVLLRGVARYLFPPLALGVVAAMLTSYLLSRTLVRRWPLICCPSLATKARPPALRAVSSKDSNTASSVSEKPTAGRLRASSRIGG